MAKGSAVVLGGSLLALACSEARIKSESGETGSEGQTLGTTSDSSSGTTGDGSSAPGLGVGGIVIFDPAPDEFPAGNELRVYLYGFDADIEDHSELIGRHVIEVSASPVSFFIPLDPADYGERWFYDLDADADMDGDGEYTCGDYAGYLAPVDPSQPEHVYEIPMEYMSIWCP